MLLYTFLKKNIGKKIMVSSCIACERVWELLCENPNAGCSGACSAINRAEPLLIYILCKKDLELICLRDVFVV